MGRHAAEGGQRGAHRAEPADSGPLATVGHVLGSTVPRKVRPPRLLRVLVLSGITVGLVLFAYSTTQIYLRFSEPGTEQGTHADPGDSGRLPATEVSPGPPDDPTPEESLEAEVLPDTERGPADRTGTAAEGDEESGPPSGDEHGPVDGGPPGAGGSPAVTYQMTRYNDSQFGGTVTITNNGTSPLDWELALGFSGVEITGAWEADWEATGDGMVARPPSYRGAIAPGESATVNFTAEGRAQRPARCSLNGGSCGL
ncbi:cellulose binding domain-containing protein [Marinitenerispora sediminis]|uniref:CBM2 domain-containing protein n=1 Tax=Marinitenerispora sediminis TaxID=1931232 RepID=A0A368TBX1_9ACTN|nr:cellulose binding domain-containing protein [Marinitenerispora sediminis]RCV54039.1 hypothetical protein DEF28_09185 [Marinitenerispora sediminis]RCV60811.1 hypothetical protein DEF23_03715 [Marinitenerispora sediminis]RCV62441.1 hypothetical protein DEF24_01125 [Marinitenerispora sediminis]